MSQCLSSGCKWQRGVIEIASPFSSCPVNTQIEKKSFNTGSFWLLQMISGRFRRVQVVLGCFQIASGRFSSFPHFSKYRGDTYIYPIYTTSKYVKRFFYKQHFYKQRQAEIGKEIKQKLNNTPRLNFCYLKIFQFFQPSYHPKIIGDILRNVQMKF